MTAEGPISEKTQAKQDMYQLDLGFTTSMELNWDGEKQGTEKRRYGGDLGSCPDVETSHPIHFMWKT